MLIYVTEAENGGLSKCKKKYIIDLYIYFTISHPASMGGNLVLADKSLFLF